MSLRPSYPSGRWPGQPTVLGRRSGSRGSWRRPRFLLLILTPVVVLAAAASVALLAAHYQPLISGGSGGGSFPGLPTGVGIRWVDSGDLYVPPQRGIFALSSVVVNTGSRPVTIEAVTLVPGSPVILAGPVQYFVPTLLNETQRAPGQVLRNITLRPGQQIMIGMPLRTWRCAYRHENTIVTAFLLRERSLIFDRTIALPIIGGPQVLLNTPGGKAGDSNTICASR